MKNTLLSVIAIMALCACNDDPEPAPRFQAIQQLYEMYGEKLIGEWENDTLQNGDVTVYEYMKLDEDMQGTYILMMKRPAGIIAGEEGNEDGMVTLREEKTVGEWSLDVDMQLNPYIAIDDTANTADRLFSFYGTDGNVMIIDTGYNTSLKKVTKP